MVYTSILIHRARMKTKGEELVKIIDICDSCAQEIFPVCSKYQYLLEQHNSNLSEVKQKNIK